MSHPTTLMLVLPLPTFRSAGTLFLDDQACNGLRLWLENFDRVVLMSPLIDVDYPPRATLDVRALFEDRSLEIVPLPCAWTPVRFLRNYRHAVGLLRSVMVRSSHLQFAIGGLWGDWGAVAALLARRAGRRAAVWTDRVESEVMRQQAKDFRGAKRLYRLFNAYLTKIFERYVISRSALGLFHGADTYSAYAQFSRAPHLVHDIHLGPDERISPSALGAKIARGLRQISIIYGGRLHPDKGVADWIGVMHRLRLVGLDFHATWYGDGPLLAFARASVAELDLTGYVDFPGSTDSHRSLLEAFRNADLFVFCHKTPESPRCLIEALISGLPLVGYESAYSHDLISANGGGLLTPMSIDALADAVARLITQPVLLSEMTVRAAADGRSYNDVDVFRHRSDLIKLL